MLETRVVNAVQTRCSSPKVLDYSPADRIYNNPKMLDCSHANQRCSSSAGIDTGALNINKACVQSTFVSKSARNMDFVNVVNVVHVAPPQKCAQNVGFVNVVNVVGYYWRR